MPGEFSYDVFLSHSAKDKRSKPPTLIHDTAGNAVVRDVPERLKKDGPQKSSQLSTLISQLPPRLERSRVLVLCMSANAFGSDPDWSGLESGTFRFRDPLNKERRFLPLRLDDAPFQKLR